MSPRACLLGVLLVACAPAGPPSVDSGGDAPSGAPAELDGGPAASDGGPVSGDAGSTVAGPVTPPTELIRTRIPLMGSGYGDLTADGHALDCPDAQPVRWTVEGCVGDFPLGATVTLRAKPRPGSRFGGWVQCAGRDECSFTVTRPSGEPWEPYLPVTAVFDSAPEKPRYRFEWLELGGPARAHLQTGAWVAGMLPQGPFVWRIGSGAPTIVPEPAFVPRVLSSNGVLAGCVDRDDGCRDWLLFRDGRLVPVPAPRGEVTGSILGVNAAGHVLGTYMPAGAVDRYSADARHFFFDGARALDVASLPGVPPDVDGEGHNGFKPRALGEQDEIAGRWDVGWKSANPEGTWWSGGERRVAVLKDGAFREAASAEPVDGYNLRIGPGGHVIGSSGIDAQATFVWNGPGLAWVRPAHEEWNSVSPAGINTAGTLVGRTDTECLGCDHARRRAIVVEGLDAADLNELTDTRGAELEDALGIDEAGRIVGNAVETPGRPGSPRRAYLLTPLTGGAPR